MRLREMMLVMIMKRNQGAPLIHHLDQDPDLLTCLRDKIAEQVYYSTSGLTVFRLSEAVKFADLEQYHTFLS